MSDLPTLRTVLVNPPSATGYAGARNRRHMEYGIRSVWYPTWLAQAAAEVPSSKLIDAAADGLSVGELLLMAKGFELCVLHAAKPTLAHDLRVAAQLKEAYPDMRIGFVGTYVGLHPECALGPESPVDFVARGDFGRTVAEVAAGAEWSGIAGLSHRRNGRPCHNPEGDGDSTNAPSVLPVYRRDLRVESYAVNYLRHPFLSLYTGRREPRDVVAEVRKARELFPEVREIFFDDETLMLDLERAARIADGLGKLGVPWSTKTSADLPRKSLEHFARCGLRLLAVNYDTGSPRMLDLIQKDLDLESARAFTRHCRELGVRVHGSFLLGLPRESWQSIRETIGYACALDIDSMHVSLTVPPVRTAAVPKSELDGEDLLRSLFRMYTRFYLRPRPLWRMLRALWRNSAERRRRVRSSRDFLKFLWSGPDPFAASEAAPISVDKPATA